MAQTSQSSTTVQPSIAEVEMQVEYEDLPQTIAPSGLQSNPAEGQQQMDSDSEPEQEEEEEEEEAENVEDQEETAPKEKKKRVIKQRQSLAEKQRGTTIFPISRIKRIIKADKDLDLMTGEACFMVSVATEYFIKHFMEEGYAKARLDKRKIVNYKDMAAVVERSEEFDFLRDVIPMPIPLSEALQRRQNRQEADPTMTEETQDDLPPSDDLPPLIPSTNPAFPNAIVKRPPNTHARVSMKPKPSATDAAETSEAEVEDPGSATVPEPAPAPVPAPAPAATVASASKEVATPKVPSGKNGPTTPHGLSTRRSARRSLAASEAESMPIDEVQNDHGRRRRDVESPTDRVNGSAGGIRDAAASSEPVVSDAMDQD